MATSDSNTLASLLKNFEKSRSAGADKTLMQKLKKGVDDLYESNVIQKTLKVGDKSPDFT